MSLDSDPLLRTDRQVRREVEEDFDFHFEMVVEELRAQGLAEGAAREQAELRFGPRERHLQACRQIGKRRRRAAKRRAWWHDLGHDRGARQSQQVEPEILVAREPRCENGELWRRHDQGQRTE